MVPAAGSEKCLSLAEKVEKGDHRAQELRQLLEPGRDFQSKTRVGTLAERDKEKITNGSWQNWAERKDNR